MPSYTFENKETGEQQTLVLSLAEHDTWAEENPGWFQVMTLTPGTGFIPDNGIKPSQHFNDILKGIKKKNRGSTVQTFY